MSPLLFNVNADEVSKEAPEQLEKGIKIDGILLNNTQYADDTVLLADSVEALQLILDKVNDSGIQLWA